MNLERQAGLVPLDLREVPIKVAGCGTTGSWTAYSLLSMGFSNVSVYDFDILDETNYPAQFLLPVNHAMESVAVGGSNGYYKVESFRRAMALLDKPIPVEAIMSHFPAATIEHPSVVFSCTDSFEARREIARDCQANGNIEQLIDLRMGPEMGSVLFTGPHGPMSYETYMNSLSVDAVNEETCGKRALLTTGMGLVALTLGHWLAVMRGDARPRNRISIHFKTGITVEEEA